MADEGKRALDPKQCLESIMASPLYQELKDTIGQKTIFEILGIQSRELPHASLVGWLLNPQESHGLGRLPLHQFLLTLCRKKYVGGAEKLPIMYDCLNAWTLDSLPLEQAIVETEYPLARKKGRADILVSIGNGQETIPFILIEYKVEAGPHGDQLKVYRDWARNQHFKLPGLEDLKHPILVYLSPTERESVDPGDEFAILNYDDLVDWLTFLTRSDRLAPRVKFLLNEFLACLSTQDYVINPKAEELIIELKRVKNSEFTILADANLNQLGLNPERHVDTLRKLGIRMGRVFSKGDSETVKQLHELIRSDFSGENWMLGGKTGSLSIWSADYRMAFENVFTKERLQLLGYPSLMIYLGRPVKGEATLEFYAVNTGGESGLARDKFRQLIADVSEDLRHWLDKAGLPDGELVKRGNGIAKLLMRLPGINNPEDDIAEIANAERRCEIQRAGTFLRWIKTQTDDWAREEMPQLLEAKAGEIIELVRS
ncbi:MAG TPA: PD-(D/E)XK nuclease family protein [Acidobacteriota bacterium]|nr:PD-(D/E)XK nuclease family protein [Acidobacteriota bacterium]HQM63845.1 PD-(D/E)XK nuclease family protein [Acidobacteriota bacterium]